MCSSGKLLVVALTYAISPNFTAAFLLCGIYECSTVYVIFREEGKLTGMKGDRSS